VPALTHSPALVTGAGRGIGRAIAERLGAEGASVTLVARTRADIEAVAAGIVARGGAAHTITADVTDPPAISNALTAAAARFGPLRLLVNNAGIPGPYGPIGTVDPLDWWNSQRVHLLAPLLTMNTGLIKTNETFSRSYRAWLLFVLKLLNLVFGLVGVGIGPTLIGVLSDAMAHRAFGVGSFAALRPGGKAVPGAYALISNACAAASATGILQAIGIFSVFFAWAAVHFLLAGRRLERDLDKLYA
jgi:NAD(P)-dependent dehydrogenase (short-subunit alcohol dehydrogenase family)